MRQAIMDAIDDAVLDFFVYDRKECETLPLGAIEEAIKSGEISYGEIVDRFKDKIFQSVDL